MLIDPTMREVLRHFYPKYLDSPPHGASGEDRPSYPELQDRRVWYECIEMWEMRTHPVP